MGQAAVILKKKVCYTSSTFLKFLFNYLILILICNFTSCPSDKSAGLPVPPSVVTVVANPSPANVQMIYVVFVIVNFVYLTDPLKLTLFCEQKTKTEASNKGVEGAIVNADETWRTCEVKYGSYCLWREENKEPMKDAKVKHMKDLLFVARAYYPSIAKMPSQTKLTRDMKQNIQEFERILSESSADADLPPQ